MDRALTFSGLVLGLELGFAAAAMAGADLETVSVCRQESALVHSAEGVVEAVRQSTVSAQIPGRIVELLFDVGDTVRKGQVIARIDESEVAQSLAESRALVAQAQTGLENARASYERTLRLFERKFVSQAALDKAEAEFKAARALVDARRAAAGLAATTRAYATVVAPYSGVVARRHVELGETVTPGKPLMTGFDPSRLRVVATLPQQRLSELDRGAPVEVEFPVLGLKARALNATLRPAADPTTHTTEVRLELAANLPGVYPGMFARALFPVGRRQRLVVPQSAILRRSEIAAVYVVGADNSVRLRQVRLGEPLAEGLVEVLAGVGQGERVALDPVKAGIELGARGAQPSAAGR